MAFIKTRKHIATTQLVALAASLPLAAHAAPPTEEKVTQLPTIEIAAEKDGYKAKKVSSAKFTQDLVDTTQTISVIKKEVLEDQNVTTLTEALRNVPGVGVFGMGENGRMNTGDAVSIRGSDAANSIFIDGIRDVGNITRDVFNTEQIEVFKGAAGTDNGRTAATGSINMTSKKANLNDANTVTLGAGSDDYYRSTADLNKKINDTTAFRFNAMGENSNGIGRDVVENKKWGVAGSLGLGLGTDTRAYVNYLHIEQNNIPDAGVSVVGRAGYDAYKNATLAQLPTIADYLNSHKVDSSTYFGSNSDFDDAKADMATIQIEHDLSDKTMLSSSVRWGEMTHRYLTTTPGASLCTTINCITAANGGVAITDSYDPSKIQIGRSTNWSDTKNQIFTNQNNIATTFNTGSIEHNLSTGVELAFEEMNTYGNTVVGTVGPTYLYNPSSDFNPQLERNGTDTKASMDTYSVYVFDTLKLSPKFQVNAGLRLDNYHLNSESYSTTAATTSVKDSGNLFNWKLGALFKPTENGSLYANYSLQQQAPGTITGGDGIGSGNIFAPAEGLTSGNGISADPQETHNYEIGTKWDLFDQKLLLTGALFYTELTNLLEQDATTKAYYQTGKKTVKGVELGVVGQITDFWNVTAGYTYQDSKLSNVTETKEQKSADGSDSIPFTPTDAFTLWTTYKTDKWSIGGGTRYTGEMTKSNDGNQTGPAKLPDYWVADAMAGYQFTKNVGLQFNVNNIFDKEYIASINRGGNRFFPGAERNYRATLTFKF